MIVFSTDRQTADRQIDAIIFYLTAFGYIDGEFDVSERVFVREYIRRLVESRIDGAGVTDPSMRRQLVDQFNEHFLNVFRQTDNYVRELFSESFAEGEDLNNFVYAKLKLRAFEIYQSFDETNQRQLLSTVEELIAADGVIHPAEVRFRDEVKALLQAEAPQFVEPEKPAVATTLSLQAPWVLRASGASHPILDAIEHPYSRDPHTLMNQAATDYQLISTAIANLDAQRQRGEGRLQGKASFSELAGGGEFLDGYVYCLPPDPGKSYELLVLGDLHGCYSCFKAALMQSNFFGKVEAHKQDPVNNPDMRLVLLGDYIDRGIYSLEGILRAALRIHAEMPNNVFLLRGNHEYFVERNGRVMSGVMPAEAINTWMGPIPVEHFLEMKRLFDAMPTMLAFERTLMVHAGIPRDDTQGAKLRDLASLNEPDIRFQMMWSDPSEVDYVPIDLQKQNARFPFGKHQFRRFMERIGCNTLIRGHEKINEGFEVTYDEGDLRLLTIFSAGGAHNNDLPAQSNYRMVTPMALTIEYRDGHHTATPWEIDYQTYNSPAQNGLLTAA